MKATLTLFLAAVFVSLAYATSPSQTQPDALTGIWMSRTTFNAGLKGELQVIQSGSHWRATLANASATGARTGNELRFVFSGDGGRLRVFLAQNHSPAAFWIQPANEQNPAYATPLTLHRNSAGNWSGSVRPLEVPFTLYLRIFRDSGGGLLAAFRNPEQNSQGGATQFHVTQDGPAVQFSAQRKPQAPPVRLQATLAANTDTMALRWPPLDRTLTLRRLNDGDAAGFFPRSSAPNAYVYRAPAQTNDGWRTARAADAGIDETALAQLVRSIAQSDPSSARPRLIHSLLVSRHGKLVLEEYFFGYDREEPHDLRSAGKSFSSVMLGAAMLRGTPIGPQTHVYDELRAMAPFANPDRRKAQITVANLMTHTSGLACDDNDDNSPGSEDAMQTQQAQPNWWKYTLDLPMLHDPGTRYAYCSGGMNLVGAVLTAATNQWLPQLFDTTVARPLQFGAYYWNLMPNGDGYLGGGAYMRPRDLLKVGQMYLNGGMWNGRRIVSKAWIDESTAPHEDVDERTTGIDAAHFTDYYVPGFKDAYAWHTTMIQTGGKTYREYQASGNGGQLLYVIPDLDLAVAITAGNYGQGGIWLRFGDDIVRDGIIAACRRDLRG